MLIDRGWGAAPSGQRAECTLKRQDCRKTWPGSGSTGGGSGERSRIRWRARSSARQPQPPFRRGTSDCMQPESVSLTGEVTSEQQNARRSLAVSAPRAGSCSRSRRPIERKRWRVVAWRARAARSPQSSTSNVVPEWSCCSVRSDRNVRWWAPPLRRQSHANQQRRILVDGGVQPVSLSATLDGSFVDCARRQAVAVGSYKEASHWYQS